MGIFTFQIQEGIAKFLYLNLIIFLNSTQKSKINPSDILIRLLRSVPKALKGNG